MSVTRTAHDPIAELTAAGSLPGYVLTNRFANRRVASPIPTYDDGYTAGYAAGSATGYADGYAAGSTAGYATGYTAGHADGYTAGYDDGYAAGVLAAPPVDSTPPTITIVSPTPGVAPGQPGGFPKKRSLALVTPIVLRIADADPGLEYLGISVRFYGSADELAADENGVEETVYRRGNFRGKHVDGSTAVVDGGDLVLTIHREGGWLGRYIKFAIDPIDGDGNLT